MRTLSTIELLGDSVLQGIQVNPENKRYYKKNDINTALLSKQFKLQFQNDSRFGCTVTKGSKILTKLLDNGLSCDAIVMDFGGNDCDFKWAEIAANPDGSFTPHTPIQLFLKEYKQIIQKLKSCGITPILTTLPPLEPQRFFDWWCGTLNKDNVLKWLGSIATIYQHQEHYSSQVAMLAAKENVPLIDIRAAFLAHGSVDTLICEDGTHPNSNGQRIITDAFYTFFEHYETAPTF